jgi:hypothetical protein
MGQIGMHGFHQLRGSENLVDAAALCLFRRPTGKGFGLMVPEDDPAGQVNCHYRLFHRIPHLRLKQQFRLSR